MISVYVCVCSVFGYSTAIYVYTSARLRTSERPRKIFFKTYFFFSGGALIQADANACVPFLLILPAFGRSCLSAR